MTRSRRSLDGLFGRDAAERGIFADAVPEQLALACLVGTQTIVGVIAWSEAGREPFPLDTMALRRDYGIAGAAWRRLLYAARCRLVTPADARYLTAIWVHPRHRGYGIGGALLRRMMADAPVRMVADVRRHSDRTTAFFRHAGFTPRPALLLRLFGFRRLVAPAPHRGL